MSIAAETYVESIVHPQVKGSVLALLRAIAKSIPEGQTATPTMAIEDLATPARHHLRTAYRARDILTALEILHVIDGGRGRPARYELVGLTGARPLATAPLPLLRTIPRRARPKRETSDSTPNLFDQPVEGERTVENVWPFVSWQFVIRCANVWRFVIRWLGNIWQFVIRCANVWAFVIRSAPPQGVDDARAGAIRKSKYVVEKYEVVGGARAREVDEFLDWFAAEYASVHQGARCTIERAADGERVNELLDHGRTIERLKAMTLRLWHVTTDGVVGSNRWYIAERAPVRNIWLLHRKADFLDIEVSLAQAPDVEESDLWPAVLKRLEAHVSSDTLHAWLRPLVVVDAGDVIQIGGQEAHVSFVQRNHGELVRQAVEAERPGARVEFVTDTEQRKYG